MFPALLRNTMGRLDLRWIEPARVRLRRDERNRSRLEVGLFFRGRCKLSLRVKSNLDTHAFDGLTSEVASDSRIEVEQRGQLRHPDAWPLTSQVDDRMKQRRVRYVKETHGVACIPSNLQ